MLCNKCLDHHEPGPCPPVWEACALVSCQNCNNTFVMPHDACFGLNTIQCGQCGETGYFISIEWTDEWKEKYNMGKDEHSTLPDALDTSCDLVTQTNKSEIRIVAAPQRLSGDIIFKTKRDVEILRLNSNGDILVKSKLIENDKQVVKALREFIEYHKI